MNHTKSSSSASRAQTSPLRLKYSGTIDFDINNNTHTSATQQARLVYVTSRHSNEGFFGRSENIPFITHNSIQDIYNILTIIGTGNFSKVHCAIKQTDGQKCALKEIDKTKLQEKWFFVENEYGDLFEKIKEAGRLSEKEAASVVYQISSALDYLHKRKVVHRDVKLENVVLFSNNVAKVCHAYFLIQKLCDFGLCCIALGPLYRVCGTPTYCAPEILKETDRQKLYRQIKRAQLDLQMPEWRVLSRNARKLICQLLNLNADRRPKAVDILVHPWIVENFNNVE